MPPLCLDDAAVRAFPMAEAVRCMADALERHAAGNLEAPARFGTPLHGGRLTFTLGAFASTPGQPQAIGFRVYDLDQIDSAARGEATLVFCSETGALRGVVTGRLLGAVRTGALGGVAIDTLAPAAPRVLALIGSGLQARTQLAAAGCVRSFASVRVFSRNPERREAMVQYARDLGMSAAPSPSAQAAVHEADVVITATDSPRPVLEGSWLRDGVHINQIGPSMVDAEELSVDVAEAADVVATDSLTQRDAEGERYQLHGHPVNDRLVELGAIRSGRAAGRRSDRQRTFFSSLGLAGTEVMLADRILAGHTQD